MSAPALVIVLELEAAPRVLFDCINDAEWERLQEWFTAHPELLDPAVRALELCDELEAA
jgi:hypothetical protein